MSFIAGDVKTITCTDPVLGSFRFSPKAKESFNLDKGGIRNEITMTGNGQAIIVKSVEPWSCDGPVAVDMVSGNEFDGTAALAAQPQLSTWTWEMISGAIYKGLGTPIGELKFDSNTGTMPLKVQGSGQLELIS